LSAQTFDAQYGNNCFNSKRLRDRKGPGKLPKRTEKVPVWGIVNVRNLWCNWYENKGETSPNGGCSFDWLHWRYMRFDLITIFPEFFAGPLNHGILRRARESGLAEVHVQDLRVFTKDRHRTVDDRPFGGGEGMVLKPEPLFEAVESLLGHGVGDATRQNAADPKTAIVLMSAAGKLFNQETARKFARMKRIIFVCGRYEGVDERVAEYLATDEISIGDFVLSGGELPAMMIVDAVTRLLPGALGNEASSQNESFSADAPGDAGRDSRGRNHSLLDFPHYTRPAEYRGWSVPEVLIGGNHAEVAKWRRAAALEKTRRNRPDLV
jgi:tRNA (guanine37-N1)-methyltransferase